MDSNKIEGKIQTFVKNNPQVKDKSQKEILSIMVSKGVITPAEMIKVSAFRKTGGVNSDKGFTLEKNAGPPISEPKLELSREEAQYYSLSTIGDGALAAETLYKKQRLNQGDLSDAYDIYKEITKDDLSAGKVKQAITLEKLGYTYLNQAQSGTLTKREYYEHVKEDLMLMTPGYKSFSAGAKAEYKARIDSLTIEEVKLLQRQLQNLPDKDSPEYNSQAAAFIKNLKTLTEEAPIFGRSGDLEVGGYEVKTKLKPPVQYPDSDELIKFEEVFEYERGTKFSKEKIADFEIARSNLQLAQSTTDTVKKVHKYLDMPLANPRGDWQASDLAKVEMGLQLSLEELFGKDKNAQQEGLIKMLGGEVPNNTAETAHALLAKLDEDHAKIMNGKSLEDFQQEYADSYVEAYGRKNSQQLAKAYLEDNETIDERISGGMQIGGMIVMAAGGVLCLIPGGQIAGGALLGAGGKVAMTGMVAQTALGAWNESTKSGGLNDEAAEKLTKDGLTNLASFVIGAGAGIKGAQVRAALTAKGSGKFVSLVAERGTDLAISMAGDMILTGNLNVEGNMIGQLTAAITGLKTGKTIANKYQGIPKPSEMYDTPALPKGLNPEIFSELGAKSSSRDVRNMLSDIEATIGTVKDKKLSQYLTSTLKQLNEGSVSEADLRFSLAKAREVIDVYNTVNGYYSNIGAGAEHQEFMKFAEEYYPQLAQAMKRDSSLKTQVLKKIADGNWSEDFKTHVRYSKLINFIKHSSDTELSDYFYNNYYLKEINLPKSIKSQYARINDKYNVKIIASPLSTLDLKKSADTVEKELAEWHNASGGEAKLPPVINFLGTNKIYYERGAGGYAGQQTHALGLNGLNVVVDVGNFLRHEITHINDKKITGDSTTDYSLPSDIAPYQLVNNPSTGKTEMKLDFANCKYRDEFLKAGVDPSHVAYAYTNTKEFIAVASEGDMSKYSPEFRGLLIKMGMPEWQFKMRNFDENTTEYVQTAQKLLDENPDKTLDEVVYKDKQSAGRELRADDTESKIAGERRDYNEISKEEASKDYSDGISKASQQPEKLIRNCWLR